MQIDEKMKWSGETYKQTLKTFDILFKNTIILLIIILRNTSKISMEAVKS